MGCRGAPARTLPGPPEKPASMNNSQGRFSEISHGEAMSLLAGASLGRIVFTDQAMPTVRPVSHIVEAGDLIVRNDHDIAIIARSAPGQRTVVAYQADDIDPITHLGWSVVVTGTARLICDPVDIARYERVLRPWAAAGAGQFIRVHARIVTGYRLVP